MTDTMTTRAPYPFVKHTLIRASAGAGKTYALSSQFIALLYQGATPASILATTFTRKAAGEILGKVLLRLAKAAIHPKDTLELGQSFKVKNFTQADAQKLLKTLCADLHRVNISTLDAFFSRLASSFRLELDLPLDAAMVDANDPQARRARAECIEAMLADSENDPSLMVGMLKRVHHDHINRSVTSAIDNIVSRLHELYRTSPSREVWARLKTPDVLDEDNLEFAREQLRNFIATADLSKGVRNTLEKSYQDALISDWENFLGRGIPPKLADEEPVFNRKPVEEDVIEVLRPIYKHAKADSINRIAKQTIATWELLRDYDEHDKVVRRARRLLTFSDLPFKLARELSPTSDVDDIGLDAIYYRIDGQVQHLLLDEFQDTSPLQWQVLRPIAEEIVNQEGHDRSFFCVGDVKQSIYSWRGGCAELFDKLTQDLYLPDNAQHALNSSYRTSQAVLDVVNDLFQSLPQSLPVTSSTSNMVPLVAGELTKIFVNHKANYIDKQGFVKLVTSGWTAEELYGDAPEINASEYDVDDDFDADTDTDEPADDLPPDQHTQYVARYIRQLAHQHPKRSVGVLVRTNRMVNQLIHLLQKQGVKASGEGGNPVTDDPAVDLILAALQLADHPGHSIARHHVARSPLANIIGLVDLSPPQLEDFSRDIRDRLVKKGYAAVIDGWAASLANHGDKRSATRLDQLVQLAQTYEAQATSRPGDFVDFVNATPVEEPETSPVRVMTVHKSKGLEFDVVVLPELHGRMGLGSYELSMVYREHPTEDPAAIYRYAKKEVRALSPELQKAYEQEERRRLGDDFCAMYVALTRPRHALHMIIPPLQPSKGKGKQGQATSAGQTSLSPAAILRSILALGVEEELLLQQTLYTHGKEDWDPLANKTALPSDDDEAQAADASAQRELSAELLNLDLQTDGDPSRSWRVVAPSNLEADQRVRVDDLLRLDSADGRAYGSLIHAMFEQVQWLDEPLSESQVKQIIRAARAHVPQATKGQTASASAAFSKMLAQPTIIKALSLPLATSPLQVELLQVELWRERPFAVRIDGALVNGILDRVMVYRDAKRAARSATIIDFKTDKLDESLVPDAAVEQIIARYRPQMLAYCKALASMLDLSIDAIDAKLLLVGSDQLVPVV